MSCWGPTDADRDRRLARALIVQVFGRDGVDATDYLAHRSRADPFAVDD